MLQFPTLAACTTYLGASQESSTMSSLGLTDGKVLRAPTHMRLNLGNEIYEVSSAITVFFPAI